MPCNPMASTSLQVERRVFSNSSLASLRRNAEWFYAVAVFMSVMSGANPEADSHKPTADSAGQHGQRASIDFLSPADGGRYRIDVPLFVHLHLKTDGSNQLEHSLQMSATAADTHICLSHSSGALGTSLRHSLPLFIFIFLLFFVFFLPLSVREVTRVNGDSHIYICNIYTYTYLHRYIVYTYIYVYMSVSYIFLMEKV
jgi:hypothetical protein